MRHLASRFIRWALVPLFLLGYWAYTSAMVLAATPFSSGLEYAQSQDSFQYWQTGELLKGQKLSAEFTAKADKLGIVAVRFFNSNRINDDVLIFRFKENGAPDWYYQNEYRVDQMLPNQLFTFGFPVIEKAEGKTYQFEIESTMGRPGNAIMLSATEPLFVTRHEFTRADLTANADTLVYFLMKKRLDYDVDELIFANATATLALIAIYVAFQKFVWKKLRRFLFALHLPAVHFELNLSKLRPERKSVYLWLDEFFLVGKNNRFAALDGLRAWAIFMVMSAHLVAPMGVVLDFPSASFFTKTFYKVIYSFPLIGLRGGMVGVDLFFMISGFLIALKLLERRPGDGLTLKKFMLRRLYRLLPAHIPVLLPLMKGFSLMAIAANIFFLAEFFPRFPNGNVLTWTMGYELVFYVLCGAWLIWGRKRAFLQTWRFLFLAAVLVYASRFLSGSLLSLFGLKYLDVTRFMAFFFGAGLAKLYHSPNGAWQKLEKYFNFAWLPGLVLIESFRQYSTELIFYQTLGVVGLNAGFLLLDVGLFLLVGSVLVARSHRVKWFFSLRGLRIFGITSYSFYLNHLTLGIPIAMGAVQAVPFAFPKMIAFIFLSLTLSFLIAVFLFHFLEKPYFSHKKRTIGVQ